ncbi:hypothetical protein LCGC14_2383460 [marine sediment metagenome]|uniref:Uncharacterized protein n=1 Tax=marine sediment metagenome TaxID=412755 RepID=A0A0F9EUW0_9ZZZZ
MTRLTAQDHELVKQMDSARVLLERFGLRLRGYDPGVTAGDSSGRSYEFGRHEWEWLKPILERAAPPPTPAGKPREED